VKLSDGKETIAKSMTTEKNFFLLFIYLFLVFLHLLTFVYSAWVILRPLLPGRNCSALLFSDCFEEKTSAIIRKT
jgi:hypothetical protein